MSSIIKRKIKGITYVYEQTSHYDSEKKRSVMKQVLIGKLDETTGEIVPTRKKHEITKTETIIYEAPKEKIKAHSKKSDKYSFGTTKVEGLAFDPVKNPAIYSALVPARINVSREKPQRKKIETLFYIDFNELKQKGVSIDYEYLLTPYDREIHNAVATLASAGNEYINPSMIFQILSGNTGSTNDMSPETRKSILRSIDIMMATLVTS